MSRILRNLQKVFGINTTDITEFGSPANGGAVLSQDVAAIQSTTAWENGWDAACVANGNTYMPCQGDRNAVAYVTTAQLAYLFQQGIPEYDPSTTYYGAGTNTPSIVVKPGTTQLYASNTDNNTGNSITSGGNNTNWNYLGDLANLGSGSGSGSGCPSLGSPVSVETGTAALATTGGFLHVTFNMVGNGPSSVVQMQVISDVNDPPTTVLVNQKDECGNAFLTQDSGFVPINAGNYYKFTQSLSEDSFSTNSITADFYPYN